MITRGLVDAADVVLAVGTRLQGFGFAEHQRIILLDVDPTEIGKQVPNTTALVGHARPTLGALLDELRRISDPAASRAAERQEARRRCEEELDAVGPQFQWVQWLRVGIPEDAITVVGTTTMGYACHMRFPVYQPRSYLGGGQPLGAGQGVERTLYLLGSTSRHYRRDHHKGSDLFEHSFLFY